MEMEYEMANLKPIVTIPFVDTLDEDSFGLIVVFILYRK